MQEDESPKRAGGRRDYASNHFQCQYLGTVSDSNQYNSVTVINVLADISGTTSLNNITRSLTINGNDYTVNIGSRQFCLHRETDLYYR